MFGLVLAVPATAFYLWAAFRQWQFVSGHQPANRLNLLMCTMIAAMLHLGYIGTSMLGREHINFAWVEVSSLISWVVVLLLLFSSWKKPIDNLFIGVLPLASLALLSAAISQQDRPFPQLNAHLAWHILLAILAYSVFVIAAMQAILLYLQERLLKKRQFGFIKSLPSLQTMDKLLFEIIWLGIILLTAAFLVGWSHVFDLRGQHLLHKVVFASMGWLVFVALLFGRYRFGWRGITASRWTLIGTGFLVLSYFGTRFCVGNGTRSLLSR